MTPAPASNYLKQAKHLKAIINHVGYLNDCQQRLIQLIPEVMQFSKLAHINNGKIILQTTNASFASTIRYKNNEIINLLSRDKWFNGIHTIRCVIEPEKILDKSLKTQREFSSDTALIIKNCANRVKNEQLKVALKKLAMTLHVSSRLR